MDNNFVGKRTKNNTHTTLLCHTMLLKDDDDDNGTNDQAGERGMRATLLTLFSLVSPSLFISSSCFSSTPLVFCSVNWWRQLQKVFEGWQFFWLQCQIVIKRKRAWHWCMHDKAYGDEGAVCRRIMPENHPKIPDRMNNLAATYSKLGTVLSSQIKFNVLLLV